MDNAIEVVAFLRRKSELELRILNGNGAAVATERELEATVRHLAAHPHALNAVQTARATPENPGYGVSEGCGGSRWVNLTNIPNPAMIGCARILPSRYVKGDRSLTIPVAARHGRYSHEMRRAYLREMYREALSRI
jgi:hypothetical protein